MKNKINIIKDGWNQWFKIQLAKNANVELETDENDDYEDDYCKKCYDHNSKINDEEYKIDKCDFCEYKSTPEKKFNRLRDYLNLIFYDNNNIGKKLISKTAYTAFNKDSIYLDKIDGDFLIFADNNSGFPISEFKSKCILKDIHKIMANTPIFRLSDYTGCFLFIGRYMYTFSF